MARGAFFRRNSGRPNNCPNCDWANSIVRLHESIISGQTEPSDLWFCEVCHHVFLPDFSQGFRHRRGAKT